MDSTEAVLEKPGSGDRKTYSPILSVEFIPFEWGWWDKFAPEFWAHWYEHAGIDMETPIELLDGDRSLGEVPEYELEINCLLTRGNSIQLCVRGGEVLGFMVYNLLYECVLSVPHLYFRPGFRRQKLAPALVNSLGKPIKKILFQTLADKPPELFLSSLGGRNREITRVGKLITWEMNWE